MTLNEVKCASTALFFIFIKCTHTTLIQMCVHRVRFTQINECVRRLQSPLSRPSKHICRIEIRKRFNKIRCCYLHIVWSKPCRSGGYTVGSIPQRGDYVIIGKRGDAQTKRRQYGMRSPQWQRCNAVTSTPKINSFTLFFRFDLIFIYKIYFGA